VPGACLEEEEGGCRDGVSCERWRAPRLPAYKEAQVGTQKVPGRLYTVHCTRAYMHTPHPDPRNVSTATDKSCLVGAACMTANGSRVDYLNDNPPFYKTCF
jgi:hypothetical protein